MKHGVHVLVNNKVLRYSEYVCLSKDYLLYIKPLGPYFSLHPQFFFTVPLCYMDFVFIATQIHTHTHTHMALHVKLDNIFKLMFYSFHGHKCARKSRP